MTTILRYSKLANQANFSSMTRLNRPFPSDFLMFPADSLKMSTVAKGNNMHDLNINIGWGLFVYKRPPIQLGAVHSSNFSQNSDSIQKIVEMLAYIDVQVTK